MPKTRKHATSSALAPLRAAFVARATEAVEAWSLSLSGRELALAVSAPRNELVVLHALQRPEAWAGVLDHDPLAAAKARGIEKQRDLLAAEGGAAGVDELAGALHISRQAVDKGDGRGSCSRFRGEAIDGSSRRGRLCAGAPYPVSKWSSRRLAGAIRGLRSSSS